ncbi:MAG: hypothetical protein ACM3Q2_00310 [Syntrophothermus sp.]
MEKKATVKQSLSELKTHLNEQITFLVQSASSYDNGQVFEAKRMAHSLRLLLHDTRHSKALLSQLKMKDIKWLDTASKYQKDNLVSHVGLISIRFDNLHGRIPWLVPKGLPDAQCPKIDFDKWWTSPVIIASSNYKKRYFSRQNLVLNLANTDGGSHIDPEIEVDFYELSRNNSIGFVAVAGKSEYPLLNPEFPSIRQITHELLLSIKDNIKDIIPDSYNDKITISPYGQSQEEGPQQEYGVKIRVNW